MTKSLLEVLIIHDVFFKYSLAHAFLLFSNTRHNILKNFVYSRKNSLIKLHLRCQNITKGALHQCFPGNFPKLHISTFFKTLNGRLHKMSVL